MWLPRVSVVFFSKEPDMAEKSEESSGRMRGVTQHSFCGVQGCCPSAEVNHDTNKIVIKDDFEGTVTLTMDEWCDAVKKVKF